jgi:hypothetical protein
VYVKKDKNLGSVILKIVEGLYHLKKIGTGINFIPVTVSQ